MDQQWHTHSLMYLPQVFDFTFDSKSRTNHARTILLESDNSVLHKLSGLKTGCSRLEGKLSLSVVLRSGIMLIQLAYNLKHY